MTYWHDADGLVHKVREPYTQIISRYCQQSGISLIKPNNIDLTSLNKQKFHLNKKGVAILASNLTNNIVISY